MTTFAESDDIKKLGSDLSSFMIENFATGKSRIKLFLVLVASFLATLLEFVALHLAKLALSSTGHVSPRFS